MGVKLSKRQQSRVTEENNRILTLKVQRDKLIQSQDRINDEIDKDKRDAKNYLQMEQRNLVMTTLRRKKVKDKILEQTEDKLGEVEQKILDEELHQVRENVQTIIQPFIGQQQKEKKSPKKKRFIKFKKNPEILRCFRRGKNTQTEEIAMDHIEEQVPRCCFLVLSNCESGITPNCLILLETDYNFILINKIWIGTNYSHLAQRTCTLVHFRYCRIIDLVVMLETLSNNARVVLLL